MACKRSQVRIPSGPHFINLINTMILLFWLIVFVVSLFILIKASDYFTDSAEKIGLSFGLSPFIVGVTIVAFGTSLPELASSIMAVLQNSSEIVVGNVVGSNITNIFLILGISAILGKTLKIDHDLISVDLPMFVGSAFFLSLTILDGKFSIGEAILAIIGIILYTTYTAKADKKENELDIKIQKDKKKNWIVYSILTLSIIFIYLGAKYTVDSVIKIAEILKIGKEIIAIGVVALGTSLPELVVSIRAAKKGKAEIAIGNILGSNIFNIFAVMGISALFGTLIIPNSIITFGLPVMLVATLLYFFITQDKKITIWEGWLLILFYVFFVGKLMNIV